MILQFFCSIYFRTDSNKETVHRYTINSLPKHETRTTAYLIDGTEAKLFATFTEQSNNSVWGQHDLKSLSVYEN